MLDLSPQSPKNKRFGTKFTCRSVCSFCFMSYSAKLIESTVNRFQRCETGKPRSRILQRIMIFFIICRAYYAILRHIRLARRTVNRNISIICHNIYSVQLYCSCSWYCVLLTDTMNKVKIK